MERDAARSRRQIPDRTHAAAFGDLIPTVDGHAVGSGKGGRCDDGESHREGVQFRESTDHLSRLPMRTAASGESELNRRPKCITGMTIWSAMCRLSLDLSKALLSRGIKCGEGGRRNSESRDESSQSPLRLPPRTADSQEKC